MADDIFSGDKKIDGEKKEKPETFGSATLQILKGIKVLLLKRFGFNLLLLLIIIIIASIIGYNLKSIPECNCPEISCPVCEPETVTEYVYNYVCPNGTSVEKESMCNITPEVITETEYEYRYVCPKGGIVEDKEDCGEDAPIIETPYVTTKEGVTISIDSIKYEKTNGTVTLKQINYTIINKGLVPIKPVVGLKVYDRYTQEVKEEGYERTFKIDQILDVKDWIVQSNTFYLEVTGLSKTVRLELVDTIPDPNEVRVNVYRKVEFD